MPRGYSNIEQYESEIIKLKEEGYTHKEIGEKLGLTKKQIKADIIASVLHFTNNHVNFLNKSEITLLFEGVGQSPANRWFFSYIKQNSLLKFK